MREQLNSNPLAQLAVVGVLIIGAGFFLLSSSGGGEESEGSASEAAVGAVAVEEPAAVASSVAIPSAADAPPLPQPVLDAWQANQTIVLLFTRDGGIDDRLVTSATAGVASFPDAAIFVVPAARIARYAAITEGVGVERVPALVVVTPKHLKRSVPTASVSYGFQSPQSVTQAVIDAGYRGKTLDYHP